MEQKWLPASFFAVFQATSCVCACMLSLIALHCLDSNCHQFPFLYQRSCFLTWECKKVSQILQFMGGPCPACPLHRKEVDGAWKAWKTSSGCTTTSTVLACWDRWSTASSLEPPLVQRTISPFFRSLAFTSTHFDFSNRCIRWVSVTVSLAPCAVNSTSHFQPKSCVLTDFTSKGLPEAAIMVSLPSCNSSTAIFPPPNTGTKVPNKKQRAIPSWPWAG